MGSLQDGEEQKKRMATARALGISLSQSGTHLHPSYYQRNFSRDGLETPFVDGDSPRCVCGILCRICSLDMGFRPRDLGWVAGDKRNQAERRASHPPSLAARHRSCSIRHFNLGFIGHSRRCTNRRLTAASPLV